jgi:hypothetical protein
MEGKSFLTYSKQKRQNEKEEIRGSLLFQIIKNNVKVNKYETS